LKVSRRLFSKETVGNYKQETLVKVLLQRTYAAHDSTQDVLMLQELFVSKIKQDLISDDIYYISFKELLNSFTPLMERKYISSFGARKLAQKGISYNLLKVAQNRNSSSGVKLVLQDIGFKKKAISNIEKYLQEE
jgi:hypothetical protein